MGSPLRKSDETLRGSLDCHPKGWLFWVTNRGHTLSILSRFVPQMSRTVIPQILTLSCGETDSRIFSFYVIPGSFDPIFGRSLFVVDFGMTYPIVQLSSSRLLWVGELKAPQTLKTPFVVSC